MLFFYQGNGWDAKSSGRSMKASLALLMWSVNSYRHAKCLPAATSLASVRQSPCLVMWCIKNRMKVNIEKWNGNLLSLSILTRNTPTQSSSCCPTCPCGGAATGVKPPRTTSVPWHFAITVRMHLSCHSKSIQIVSDWSPLPLVKHFIMMGEVSSEGCAESTEQQGSFKLMKSFECEIYQ